MTKIVVYKSKDKFIGFSTHGHSKYDRKNKDIVCAAISSTVQMTILGITEVIGLSSDIKIDDKKPSIECVLKENNNEAQVLINSMVLYLKELEKFYSLYMKIEEMEVEI